VISRDFSFHFIVCINGLPLTTDTLSILTIFADNTSVIICSKKCKWSLYSVRVLSHMGKWFTAKKLALNLDETNVTKCIINNLEQWPLNIGYSVKCFHVYEWLQTGFGLVIGFIDHLQIITTSIYNTFTNFHTLQIAAAQSFQFAMSSPVVPW
jgi:hypothetical protein